MKQRRPMSGLQVSRENFAQGFMKASCVLLGIAYSLGIAVSQPAFAADADSSKAATAASPDEAKGSEIIKHTFDFYNNLKSFSFTLTANMLEDGTANPKRKCVFDMAFTRPNKCAIDLVEGELGCKAFSNGKTLTIFNSHENQYVSLPAPDQISQVMENPAYLSLDRGLTLLALTHTLVAPDPFATLRGKETVKVTFVDTTKIDNIECDHLKMAHWDIYVRKSGDPWVQRVTADITRRRPESAEGAQKKSVLVYDYSKQVSSDVPDTKFAFTPPKGAQEIKMPERDDSGAPIHPLTGKMAPNFTVDTLEGKSFELAKNKGHVVVLDFWATWCPPCRMGLPIVTDVTKSLESKGVVFLAVNERESPKQIKDFLEKASLSPNVGLDKDGAVGTTYKAQGIPQTVIIDKTGKIAKIDVGFSENLKEDLTKTITDLLK